MSWWWKRLPFFYGWIIVAVTFICFAVGYATWHSFSIFYVAILEEYGWSRAATAATFSVFTMVYGFYSPVAGGLIDLFGPRRILPLGAIILGIGLLLTTRLSTLLEFYLLFGVIAAVGLSSFGSVPAFTVLNGWFVKKRGLAGGLATAGIGVGTLVLVPFLQSVILNYGWRTAYVLLAVATMTIIPVLAVAFQRHRPQDLGLRPDGEEGGVGTPLGRAEQGQSDAQVVDREWASREWTLRSAVRTRRFWLISMARGLEMMALQMMLTHQAAFFVDIGVDKLVAASVVGTVGIVGSGGKILWGAVSDRVGRELAYTMAFVAGTLGIGIILSIHSGSPPFLAYGYGAVYGLCYGASAVLTPVLSADIFHGKRYGSILGGIYVVGNLGAAVGAFLGGYAFDVTGSYQGAFMLAIPGMWLSCLLYWLAAPRKVRMVAGRAKVAARLLQERG
ncbi:MAG: MFS transporter [Chloroflexota bacterium]